MVSIRLRLEISTPTGEGVESFPILPGDLMVPGIDQIFTATVKEIDVNGETNQVKRIADPLSCNRIELRLMGAAHNLADGAIKTLVVDIIEQPREEPRKEAPLLTKSQVRHIIEKYGDGPSSIP